MALTADLFEAWRQGKIEDRNRVWEIVFDRCYPLCCRWAGGDDALAADVLHDTFGRFQENYLKDFEWQGEAAFFSFFHTRLKFDTLAALRRQTTAYGKLVSLFSVLDPAEESETLLIDVLAAPQTEEAEDELFQDLQETFKNLTPREKELFEEGLAIIDSLSGIPGRHEFSRLLRERLGVDMPTISPPLSRLRKRLEPLMKKWFHMEET